MRTFALAATMLLPTLVRPVPAFADDPIVRDHRGPLGRLEILLKSVHIYDDSDWGEGEITVRVVVGRKFECPESQRGGLDYCFKPIADGRVSFNADSGETVALNRVMPAAGDEFLDPGVGAGIGFPVHAGPGYYVTFYGDERDPGLDDSLGAVGHEFGQQDGWGLGSYDERGHLCQMKGFIHHYSDCKDLSKFSVQYEIRRAELPDLLPTEFRVNAEVPGDRDDQVCFTVQNRGPLASEPFSVNIAIEGALPPMQDVGALGLAAGETREQCTGVRLPDSGGHQLTLVVDRQDGIPEMDDTNNTFERILLRTPINGDAGNTTTTTGTNANPGTNARPDGGAPPVIQIGTWNGPATDTANAPAPASAPASSQAQADLTVTSVKVNGRAPDGKDDCKDGKNTVIASVKNAGGAKAGSFAVRLVVDGADGDALEQTVNGLDDGKEREVRFEDVRLKKGEHKLALTADPKGSVAEASEDNNGKTVTAACQSSD